MVLFRMKSLLISSLRLFFHLLYHPFAWAYDLVSWIVSVGRWKHWVLAASSVLEGPKILELGFGPGHLHAHMSQKGFQVFGLDESPQMARLTLRKLLNLGMPNRIVRGLAQNLPFTSDVFNCVVATFPTNYIFQPATLDEIYRVLAVQGKLVVLIASSITGKSLADRFVSLLFHLTRQNPSAQEIETTILLPFIHAGFDVSTFELYQDSSRLIFIHALKPIPVEYVSNKPL